jgi:LPS-assembly protein
VELGWQWPLWRGKATPVGAAGGCGGTLYAVGRVNYSLRTAASPIRCSASSTTPAAGSPASWPSGCPPAAEATTRLMLQLELVGLSRLGSNPLQVLKDNVPGYRLLREERGDPVLP